MPAPKGLQVQTRKARKVWPSCFTFAAAAHGICAPSSQRSAVSQTPKGNQCPLGSRPSTSPGPPLACGYPNQELCVQGARAPHQALALHTASSCSSLQSAGWSGQGFRTQDLGSGVGSVACTEGCLRGWREACVGDGDFRGSALQARRGIYCACTESLPPARGSGGRSAPHTGVEWGVGGVSTLTQSRTHARFARPPAAGRRAPGAPRASSVLLPPAPAPSPARHRVQGEASGLEPQGFSYEPDVKLLVGWG